MKPHIVYVLGSGHSGSTIFQYLICSQDAVLGLGEVRHMAAGKGWRGTTGDCSCGVETASCPVWKHLQPNEGETSRQWYARLASQVAERFPDKTHWVDTSKSTDGILPWLDLLSEGLIASVRVIYLVRDVRGWAVSHDSAQKRKGRPGRSLLLSIDYWRRQQQHFRSFLQNRESAFQHCVVSYESVIFQNRLQAARLSEFLGFARDETIPGVPLDTATVHDVFGNRLRIDREKRSTLKYDDRWQYRYGLNLLALCHYPAWRLNVRLRWLGSPG
jgi:hypothetical protein